MVNYNKKWHKQYYKNNKEKILKYHKQYNKDNQLKARQYSLNRLYGLSHEDWLKMWERQDGKCAICGKEFRKPSDGYVDHNHDTGEIRGLLCVKCNFGIGYFNNNPEIMRKAIRYLKY